jgi:hypothetical protein
LECLQSKIEVTLKKRIATSIHAQEQWEGDGECGDVDQRVQSFKEGIKFSDQLTHNGNYNE